MLLLSGLALPVLAASDAPLPLPRPDDLGQTAPVTESAATPEASPVVPLPRARPEVTSAPATVAPDKAAPATSTEPPPVTSEAPVTPEPPPVAPEPKEERVYQTACPALLQGRVAAEALPPLHEGQCGAQSPLSITAVSANGRMVPFSTPATLDCQMAGVLPDWISAVDSYLVAHDKTRIESVLVGTSYMCRNVNNAAIGNLSFHGFADAMDVVGFKLEDGRTVTVGEAWTGSEEQGSRIVRFAHDAACTLFTTTLGPEANALHHDHLHIDLGCHGKSCTARLCE